MPGPVVQQVVSLIADQGVINLIPVQPHSFVEIDHEISSTDILLPLIPEGLLSVTNESWCTGYGFTTLGQAQEMFDQLTVST